MAEQAQENIQEESYLHEKFRKIISEFGLDEKIGKISFDSLIKPHPSKIVFFSKFATGVILTAKPSVNPQFINNLDAKIWNDYWSNKTSSFGMEYRLGPTAPTSYERKDPEWWNSFFITAIEAEDYSKVYSKVPEVVEMEIGLLNSHYEAVMKYNRQITGPSVQERKSLINGIMGE